MERRDMLSSADPQARLRKEWRRQHRRWHEAYVALLAAGVPLGELAGRLPAIDPLAFASLTCGARSKRTGNPCRLVSLCRGGRCRFHGGLSTGPKTAEGKLKAGANLRRDSLVSNAMNAAGLRIFASGGGPQHDEFSGERT
jgi:hypothetical protein